MLIISENWLIIPDYQFYNHIRALIKIVLVGRRRFSLAQTDSLLMRMRSVASDELNQMMQRRMSQENPIRASETEFVQRLQRLVVLAVNRLIYHGTQPGVSLNDLV